MSAEAAKPLQFCSRPELPGTTQPAQQARAQEEAVRTVYVGVLLLLHKRRALLEYCWCFSFHT